MNEFSGQAYVPAGVFWMGCNESIDDQCFANEQPFHAVVLSGFAVDRLEVTAVAYGGCVSAGSCSAAGTGIASTGGDPAKLQHPINRVTKTQAAEYCSWAGRRLCREAEWEKAARGTSGLKFPWGNDGLSCDVAVTEYYGYGCGEGYTWPVGSKPAGASPYGALDMVGNVWEWVSDWYGDYEVSPPPDPSGPSAGSLLVIRGGSWGDFWDYGNLRASRRDTRPPESSQADLGFRCCQSVSP